MSRVAFVATIFLALMALPALSLGQDAEIEEQIHEGNSRFIEAVQAMDPVAVASLYTSDAKILPPNSDFVVGREAITAFWQDFFDLGFNDARPVTLEVIPMGELALEVGTYTLVGEAETVLDRGKIMVLWKKEGDVWKMHRDTWNSSVPSPRSVDDVGQRPPPGSNQMLRAPLTIAEGLEVIISDVVIPPGATVPRHYHPGEEFIYVLEGSAVHVEEGQPDRTLKAGDAYVIPPRAEHAPRGGSEGSRAIVFRVHVEGEEERILVEE